MIAQLPGLTHLLMLPSQQPDAAAVGPAAGLAAVAGAAAGGVMGAGQQGPRDWHITDGALRCVVCHVAAT
jgi:hypothetical protein